MQTNQLRFGAAVVILAALCCSCGGRGASTPLLTNEPSAPASGTAAAFGLPAPATLLGSGHAVSGARQLTLSGAQIDAALPARHTAPSGAQLNFAPSWTPQASNPAGLALALYRFTVTGFHGTPELRLAWTTAPADSDCFVAIANFPANRWTFLPCPASGVVPLTPAQFAAGTTPGTVEFLAIPVVLGTTPALLSSIRFGTDPGPFQLLGVSPTTVARWDSPVLFPTFTGAEPTSWHWDFAGAANQTGVDEMNPDPRFTITGDYNCSVTATAADGTPTVFPFVLHVRDTVDKAPVLTTIWPNAGETGADITLQAMTEGGYADSWSWDFGGAATIAASTEERPTVTLGAPGVYNVAATFSNAQGSSTLQCKLYVVPQGGALPPCLFGATPSAYDGLYAGAQTTFTASITGGGQATDYAWDFGNACSPSQTTAAQPLVTLGQPGEYLCQVTGSNAVGASTASFHVTVRAPNAPHLAGIYMDAPFTAMPLAITPTVTGSPAGNWHWDFGNAFVPPTSTDEIPQITPLAAGTYHCSVAASNAAGSDLLHFDIVVTDPPVPLLTAVWGNSMTTSVLTTLSVDNSGGPSVDWAWDFPANLASPNPTQPYPSVTPLAAGTYDCSVTATNLNGSSTLSFTVTVADMLPPPIDSVTPQQVVTQQSATFFASTSCSFQMTWTWDFGGGGTPNLSTDQFPTVLAGAPGTYNGVVTATNLGGTTTFPFTYTVQP